MKKVLLMSSLYYPNVGGVENSIRAIAKSLVDSHVQVDIVSSDRDYVNGQSLKHRDRLEGAELYRYAYPKGVFGYFQQFLNCYRLLKELKKGKSYDLVVSRSPVTSVMGKMSGFKNIQYIVPSVYLYQETVRNVISSPASFVRYAFNVILQLLALLLSKRVLVFSESMKRQTNTASLGRVQADIVKPGVDLSKFSPVSVTEKSRLRSIYGLDESLVILLCLGRFSEIKQFSHAISLMTVLPSSFHLVLVGSGPEQDAYKILIDKLGIKDRVTIFSSTNNPEHFYSLADIFLMTSRYESFGQVLLEASASGLPVVCYSNASGSRNSVSAIYSGFDNLVVYVHQQNSEALKRAVLEAGERKQNSEFQKMCFHFVSEYSWGKLIEKIDSTQRSAD